jgi:glucose-6-phosphate 1-dehydrogenase
MKFQQISKISKRGPMTNKMTPDQQTQGAAAKSDLVAEPFTMVLFGASGDLTQRMIMPAIFHLAQRGLLSPEFRLIGYARTKMTDDEFRALMRKAVMREGEAGNKAAWTDFAARLSYIPAEYDGDDLQGYAQLEDKFKQLDRGTGSGARRLFYLSTPPMLFAPIMKHLSDTKLAGQAYKPAKGGWARLVIEKPFGRDLASARALNAKIARSFDEQDIYRIDHFLGKDVVQNLFALRFANGIFEPLWNRNYIDHVQITAVETLGMEGRGSYFETAGIMRDMVQNHLLQLCALIAIEPPAEWDAQSVREEKAKVLRAVRKIKPGEVEHYAVRGQYGKGTLTGKRVLAYREEPEVAADSPVETYAALKLFIDNWRWAGVPFYLRSGKRLAKSMTEIVVEFKPAPHTLFRPGGTRAAAGSLLRPNRLVASISPQEGIILQVQGKLPGQEMRLRSIDLDYGDVRDQPTVESPSAYEHLLFDVLRGDSTFFARADEVESAWKIVDPVIKKWEAEKPTDFPNYKAASSGPATAEAFINRDARRWYLPEE